MKFRHHIYFSFLILSISCVGQQFNPDSFTVAFNKAALKDKVKMTSKLGRDKLAEVYPLIKDSLDVVKEKIYYHTISNEAKFLFDIIDAKIETNQQKHHKAIFILENSLRFHTAKLEDSLEILSMLSPAYLKLRNYNKAFEIESILEYLKPRFPKQFAKNYSPKKSSIYLQLGMYAESVRELRSEFRNKTEEMKRDTTVLGNYYNDMGVHFNKANKLDSAVYYFNKAKVLVDAKAKYTRNKTYFDFFSGLIDGNIASALAKNKKYSEAILPLKKDIYYSLVAKNWLSAANSYNLIAECYLELKQYNLARLYIDSCKPLLTKIEELGPSLNNMLVEAKYYKHTGNLPLAAKNYDNYIRFKDSIQKVDNEAKLINQQISFDLYQKENELIQKEKIIQSTNLAYEHEKTKRSYLILGIVILVFIIAFLIVNNSMNRRRQSEMFIKNKHIIQQKSVIELALKEKEFLIKEIHHRVKNNLQIISSMLSLQSDVIDNAAAKEALQESKMRLNSMSLIHQMLYNRSNMVDISIPDYLEALISQIDTSYSPLTFKVKVELECEPFTIDLDTAIPLGLIVNELITNSYKHAFVGLESGLIQVTLKNKVSYYALTVKDNGIGFNYNDSKSNSLGMELIHLLVQQINGKIQFTNQQGTRVEITFSA